MGLEELFEELSKSTRCAAWDLSEKQPALNRLVLSSNLRRPMECLPTENLKAHLEDPSELLLRRAGFAGIAPEELSAELKGMVNRKKQAWWPRGSPAAGSRAPRRSRTGSIG